jgi:hypothetical protein
MNEENGVTITIRMLPTKQGYSMQESHTPTDAYADTIIEACERVARTYERFLLLGAIQGAARQEMSFNREAERLRRMKELS